MNAAHEAVQIIAVLTWVAACFGASILLASRGAPKIATDALYWGMWIGAIAVGWATA